jgi:serine phosphatase RsbU (regulator of sigma subunit)/CheY-like chemotaxis protein
MATVLVVDDDATNREFLRTLLVHRGHRVCEASDGDSALRMAGAEPPDAVITDVLMPGLDGYELARSLRNWPATSRIPIAFNTAYYAEHEMESLVRACGVQDVILKPARPQDVLAAIDALLSGAPAGPASVAATWEFADEHLNALKSKLLSSSAALRAADDRWARLQARLTETQRVTHAGTWDLDRRSGAILLSPLLRDLLRLPSSRIDQRELLRRVHPEDVERMTAIAKETLRTGRSHDVELRVAGLDGVVHEIVVSCRVAAEGTLWGVTQDLSESRAEQLRLRMQSDSQAESRVLDRLRRVALPLELPELPELPGVDLAARCRRASDRLNCGGDWYDVLPVADGRVLVSVGNVAGHKHDAVAVIGPVRAVLRAFAIEDPSPSRVLRRLDRFLHASDADDTYVTAVLALYDPAERSLVIANAGHPAPLILTPDGAVTTVPPGPALGIVPDPQFDERRVQLARHATLLAYTAGLVDRPDDPHPLPDRVARIAADAYQHAANAAHLADAVLTEVLTASAPRDDMFCIAMRCTS